MTIRAVHLVPALRHPEQAPALGVPLFDFGLADEPPIPCERPRGGVLLMHRCGCQTFAHALYPTRRQYLCRPHHDEDVRAHPRGLVSEAPWYTRTRLD